MWVQLTTYLRKTKQVDGAEGLKGYQRLVASQMYLTLVGFILIATPLVLCFAFWATGLITLVNLGVSGVLPLFANVVLIGLLGGPASRVRQITASDATIQVGVDHVASVWTDRLTPDW